MGSILKSLLCLFMALLDIQAANCQKIFHVDIQMPKSLKGRQFRCTYNNGIKQIPVDDTFLNCKLKVSDKFYSKFVSLQLSYDVNDSICFSRNYFIGAEPAQLLLVANDELNKDPFDNPKLENLLDINQIEASKKRIEFSKKQITEMNAFWDGNNKKIGRDDSITQLFYRKIDSVNKSDIAFVKANSVDYFAFWWFRTQIVPNTFVPKNVDVKEVENLLNIYNSTFAKIYDTTDEGINVKESLKEKIHFKTSGWLNIKKNHFAPDFKTKDINGNIITLSSLKGKYVLLDFWATWCGPCMAAVPSIRKIRKDYPLSKLKIIGVSGDYNYKKFSKAIVKNKMAWTHIFNDEKIANLFGVEYIPTTYLIDKKGIIVYSSKEDDNELLLELLKQM